MADSSKLQLEHPIAQRLADLAGVRYDLELVTRACDHFLANQTVGSEEAILLSRSLATFAIVTYCRTIASGVRSGVSESHLAALAKRLQNSHETFKAIRDKFVAHSVNYFEENAVQVGLEYSESGTIKVVTVGTLHSRAATFSKEQIGELKELADAVQAVVALEYRSEKDRVWDFLESLPPSELQSTLTTRSRKSFKAPHQARKRLG
jgi:hypothetical protein